MPAKRQHHCYSRNDGVQSIEEYFSTSYKEKSEAFDNLNSKKGIDKTKGIKTNNQYETEIEKDIKQ